uniref:Uncharacterized protein n=1 Tax=Candidatus Kentrum sp. FW TaxID=2126338 RepID=A0A450U3Y9_9GAMM|nr:MAG: hypothetical protein BECKFW1821C_GA0114237_11502 [Candidatus Kentron sp. FW]
MNGDQKRLAEDEKDISVPCRTGIYHPFTGSHAPADRNPFRRSISCFWRTFFIPRFSIELVRCLRDRRFVLGNNASDVKDAEYSPAILGRSGMDRMAGKNLVAAMAALQTDKA